MRTLVILSVCLAVAGGCEKKVELKPLTATEKSMAPSVQPSIAKTADACGKIGEEFSIGGISQAQRRSRIEEELGKPTPGACKTEDHGKVCEATWGARGLTISFVVDTNDQYVEAIVERAPGTASTPNGIRPGASVDVLAPFAACIEKRGDLRVLAFQDSELAVEIDKTDGKTIRSVAISRVNYGE